MLTFWPIPLLLCFQLVFSGSTVTTNLGKIEGFEYTTSSNSKAEIYLGIPFAKPPIGELRFEVHGLGQHERMASWHEEN